MLKSISWLEYLMAIAILLVVYYLFVGIRYFPIEIKYLFSRKTKLKFRDTLPNNNNYNLSAHPSHQETGSHEKTEDDEFTEIEELIDRLKTVIGDASQRKLVSHEFKQYLSMVLREYPSVRHSPLQSSINDLIISECQKYDAVTLSADELELLWI